MISAITEEEYKSHGPSNQEGLALTLKLVAPLAEGVQDVILELWRQDVFFIANLEHQVNSELSSQGGGMG